MKRHIDRFTLNGLMRLATCALMVALGLGVGEAWGKGINPAYKRYMQRRMIIPSPNPTNRNHLAKSAFGKFVRRSLASGNTNEGIVFDPDIGIEFMDIDGGYVPSLIDYSYLSRINVRTGRINAGGELPKKFDARDNGWITDIRNQRPFGTCWAHSAIGTIETTVRRTSKGASFDSTSPDYSENNMVMLTGYDISIGSDDEYDSGGTFEKAMAYLARWGGPVLESSDPYPASSSSSSFGRKTEKTPLFHIQKSIGCAPKVTPLDHEHIKRALLKYGSLWVSFYISGGVYDSNYELCPFISSDGKNYYNWLSNCDYPVSDNHAVLVVGWDDTYSKTNFIFKTSPNQYNTYVPKGDGAYLIKNSWGTEEHDEGYLWVSYYDSNMFYDKSFTIPEVEDINNYGEIYQHDQLGCVYTFPDSDYVWGANIFTATNTTEIAAVGFYAMSPNTSYEIHVYTGVTAGNPTSGTCATDDGKVGVVTDMGYVTIPLDHKIRVSKRQRFSVVVKLSSPCCDTPLATEVDMRCKTYNWFSYSMSSGTEAREGESFVSKNGSEWRDLTTDFPNFCVESNAPLLTDTRTNEPIYDDLIYVSETANLCIKAYTAGTVGRKLVSVDIVGPTSMCPGDSANFVCTAHYNDGTTNDVSSIATWSVTSGGTYATVVAGGLVTAKAVTESQLVTLRASYEEDGVKADDSWSFYVVASVPDSPTAVTASVGTRTESISVTWTPVNGATFYSVFRGRTVDSKNAEFLAKVTDSKYSDNASDANAPIPGVLYYYFVKAGNMGKDNKDQYSGFSNGTMGWRKLAVPMVTVSNDLLDRVKVTWSEVEGATHYQVYRSESRSGEKLSLGTWRTDKECNDTPPEAGKEYFYYVVAAVDASGTRPSDFSDPVPGMMVLPVTVDRLEIKGDVSITSGAYADYTADAIYTDGHRAANVSPVTWSITGDGASVANGRVTAATVTENTTVTLVATYTEDGKTARGEKEITITAVKPNAPRNVAATVTAQGVSLTWNAVAGAAQYVVYRDSGVVGRVISNAPGNAPETTFTDSTAIPGVTYSYCVSAANGAGEGPQSSPAVSATIPLPAPTGVTATSDRMDGVLVDWRRVRDNAPYQSGTYYFRVARATSETGAKTELGSWTTNFTYLDTAAPVDTPLYYFVRAATTSSGTNASDWSAPVVGRVIPNAPTLLSISISGPDRVPSSGTAMYSCTASYDDSTEPTVSPEWSVSPSSAATIDSSGMFTASAVSSDTEVTVTATYDGKTTTKKVKVIAPVVTASASVSNVRVTPRWPFSTLVDIDYTLATAPVGTMAHITLAGQDNDHNMPLAARTLTGDGASGVVAAGERRITWDVSADYPNLHTTSFSVTMTATPSIIGVPENITASASTSGVTLNWNAVENATGYEVWRGTGTTTNGAEIIATVTNATTYFDGTGTAGTTYRYWLRAAGEDGVGEFAQPVTGTRVVIVPTSLTISGASSVTAGGTTTYTCMVTRNNDTSGTITPKWSIRIGSSYASISSYGVYGVLAANVATTTRSVVIMATYEENDVTVTAIKTITINVNYVTISFNANGGMGTMADMQVPYGVATNLASNAYYGEGCYFAGWATNTTGAVMYADGASITPTTTLVLYAQWTIPLQYALDNDGLSFATGGNAEWQGVFDSSAVNGSSAKSGAITYLQSTWLRTTVSGKGKLSFRCKTSCENSYDKLTVAIDGIPYGMVSGTGNSYNTLSYSVTNAGTHTVTWTYSKDSSVSQGDDCVWIDQVVWMPILFSASEGTSTDGIELEWAELENATTYLIWRSATMNRTDATVLDTATSAMTRYTDISASPGMQYNYWLQALTTLGTVTDIGGMVSGWRNFTAPTNLTASQGTYTNYVWLTFDAPTGANFYEFYMNQTNNLSTAHSIGYVASENNPVNVVVSDGIEPGTNYYFWVRACYAIPNSTWYTIIGRGAFSESVSGYIKKYYKISFDANGGVGDMPQQDILIGATTNLAANTFTYTGYIFTGWAANSAGVVVYADGANITPTEDMTLYAKWLGPPNSVNASDATSTDEVTVEWSSVDNATSYQLWRGNTTSSDNAIQIASGLTSCTYSDTNVPVGTNYYYWVKAECNNTISDFSAYDSGRRMIAAPSDVTVTVGDTMTNLVVSWSGAVNGAIKYEIWRAMSTQKSGGAVNSYSAWSRIATVDAVVRVSLGGSYSYMRPCTSYTDFPNLTGNKFYKYVVKAVSGTDSATSNYSEIRTYENAGQYSLTLPFQSNYNVTIVGGGGGGAQCAQNADYGFYSAGGGSGACFRGVLQLNSANYTITVGNGGNATVANSSHSATAVAGGDSKLTMQNGSLCISAGGGGGGRTTGSSATGGDGGSVTIGNGIIVVSTILNANGNAGGGKWYTTGGGSHGASVYGDYGSGGWPTTSGSTGFFQITINERK